MNDFTASNGVIVTFVGSSQRWTVDPLADGGDYANVTEAQMQALREFFQAEADERLGRWRWPENTDFVVYAEQPGTDWVRVYSESQPLMVRMDRQMACHDYVDRTVYQNAARAYFDAHPEPKPWHDAEPGEIWDLDMPTGGVRAVTFYTASTAEPEIVFRDAFNLTVIDLDDPGIRDARRVFPEVQS